MNIGQKIKKFRKDLNLTQQDLADRLGTTQQMVAKYENSGNNHKIETLEKIAFALSVSIMDFLDDDLYYSVELSPEDEKEVSETKYREIMNSNLPSSEKEKALKDYMIQIEILADYHKKNVEGAESYIKIQDIINQLHRLNIKGLLNVENHINLLIQIPEYQNTNFMLLDDESNKRFDSEYDLHFPANQDK